MQYYGYLRRNPDDLPDNNFNGYDFWLAKMNEFTLPGEDARNEQVALSRVRRAEMVKAFMNRVSIVVASLERRRAIRKGRQPERMPDRST